MRTQKQKAQGSSKHKSFIKLQEGKVLQKPKISLSVVKRQSKVNKLKISLNMIKANNTTKAIIKQSMVKTWQDQGTAW